MKKAIVAVPCIEIDNAASQSISQFIQMAQKDAVHLFADAVTQSDAYLAALNISQEEMNILSSHRHSIILSGNPSILLIIKNVCGVDYGDSWRYMIQVRNHSFMYSHMGMGTCYFEVLSATDHLMVLDMIKNSNASLSQKSVWP